MFYALFYSVFSAETLVSTYRSTWRYYSGDQRRNLHSSGNLISDTYTFHCKGVCVQTVYTRHYSLGKGHRCHHHNEHNQRLGLKTCFFKNKCIKKILLKPL
jgi:hypothetical protein